jgi:prepilin-type N-terminal cleavage/methylation domain-containing protein
MRLFVRNALPLLQTGVRPALHDARTAPPRLRARRGVSIAEMVVVLVIAGIMLSIALPRFAGMRDRMSLRSAKQEVIAYIMASRAAAIRQSQPSQVHFLNNRVWGTINQPNGTNATVTQTLRTFRTRDVTLTLNGDPTANDSIVYDARGIATYPGRRSTLVLTLNNLQETICVSRAGLITRSCTY